MRTSYNFNSYLGSSEESFRSLGCLHVSITGIQRVAGIAPLTLQAWLVEFARLKEKVEM